MTHSGWARVILSSAAPAVKHTDGRVGHSAGRGWRTQWGVSGPTERGTKCAVQEGCPWDKKPMRRINANDLNALLANSTPPCISLYLPVDRSQPGKPDAVRYKNLLNEAERSLRQKYPGVNPQPLLQKFRDLPEDGLLWGQCQGGLAVLGAGDEVHAFAVPRTLPE